MKDINKSEQQKLAEESKELPLALDDKYYLINSHWYDQWSYFVGLKKHFENSSQQHPGPIDNKELLESDGSLKREIVLDIDYYLVHENLWNCLKSCYGTQSDKDTIERRVINDAADESHPEFLKVEVQYTKVKIAKYEAHNPTIQTIDSSRQAKLSDVVSRMKHILNISDNKQIKLYMRLNPGNFTEIENYEEKTLSSIDYTIVDVLFLCLQNDDSSWPDISKSSSIIPEPPVIISQYPSPSINTRSSSNKNNSYDYSNRYNSSKPGLCGLSNLGNTCFMNSAIQCMSNVSPLTEYFLSNKYQNELNRTNPLGQNGELATAWADLIKEMWNGQNSYTSPRQLKLHISRVAPQFIGYQQQDSQELLSYLLDGLHEDLNRILKKPYIETSDDDKKSDEELSKETWENYMKRNNSIIVDLFHGLVKSTLNCLECNKISVKFDPICYLSLPLPSKKERLIEVTYVPLDTSKPLTKYKLTVLKNGTINDLCNSLVEYVQVSKQSIAICDIYNSKIFHLYEQLEPVSNIREKDEIYAYQLSANYSNNSQDYFKFYFYLKSKSQYSYNSSNFGLPAVFMLPKNELNVANIYEKTNSTIKRLIGDSDDFNLNDTLNDDIDKKLIFEEKNVDNNETQSAAAAAAAIDKKEQKYFYKLFLSKSDNFEYNDIPVVDENVLSQLNNFQQNYLIIAECPPALKEYLTDNRISKNVVEHESCSTKLINKRDVLTLDDCFNLFTKKEELSDSDLWFCPNCKKHQHATKQMDLWSLPPVLIIHLKRFSYSRIYRDKIDTLVEFPIRGLDLNSYIKHNHKSKDDNYKYNLIAVSNHYGGLGGGHYTAYGQNRHDGHWYNFDDSSVSSSDETSVITPAAYLLVYLREDIHGKDINGQILNDNKMDTS